MTDVIDNMDKDDMVDVLKTVIPQMISSSREQLYTKTQEQMDADWLFSWDEKQSVEWNTYQFSDILELHKRSWQDWETHHHGSTCVVGRVRDRYVMPRIREFLAELAKYMETTE